MKKILVPTDFTPAAAAAAKAAQVIAQQNLSGITLFHVLNSHSSTLLKKAGKTEVEPREHLTHICNKLQEESGLNCYPKMAEGNIFTEINREAATGDYVMTVIGTHGAKGLRENLFGADLLKIAKKSPIPLLAVPEDFSWSDSNRKIVFPFAGHLKFENKIKATAKLAKAVNAEVLIYSIRKGQKALTSQAAMNVSTAKDYFEEHQVKHAILEVPAEGFSIGFSKQTLEYAKTEKANVIAVMSTPSEEHSAISASDKENLINNRDGKAILLTSDF